MQCVNFFLFFIIITLFQCIAHINYDYSLQMHINLNTHPSNPRSICEDKHTPNIPCIPLTMSGFNLFLRKKKVMHFMNWNGKYVNDNISDDDDDDDSDDDDVDVRAPLILFLRIFLSCFCTFHRAYLQQPMGTISSLFTEQKRHKNKAATTQITYERFFVAIGQSILYAYTPTTWIAKHKHKVDEAITHYQLFIYWIASKICFRCISLYMECVFVTTFIPYGWIKNGPSGSSCTNMQYINTIKQQQFNK